MHTFCQLFPALASFFCLTLTIKCRVVSDDFTIYNITNILRRFFIHEKSLATNFSTLSQVVMSCPVYLTQ